MGKGEVMKAFIQLREKANIFQDLIEKGKHRRLIDTRHAQVMTLRMNLRLTFVSLTRQVIIILATSNNIHFEIFKLLKLLKSYTQT